MSDRRPIIERFELETNDDVVQISDVIDVPSIGIAVLGLGTTDATIYVDGEFRGQFVDINIETEEYTNYASGEYKTLYGAKHVLGQRVI